MVYNKIDQLKSDEHGLDETPMPLEQLKASFLNGKEPPSVFISAIKKQHLDDLREVLGKQVAKKYYKIYPHYLKGY